MILKISLATPPLGLLLFVAKEGAAPEGITMRDIIYSVTLYIGMALLVVALLIALPLLTLLLPSLIVR